MTWIQFVPFASAAFVVWIVSRRADREFRRGYLLALDHVEGATRGRRPLLEVLRMLRSEVKNDCADGGPGKAG